MKEEGEGFNFGFAKIENPKEGRVFCLIFCASPKIEKPANPPAKGGMLRREGGFSFWLRQNINTLPSNPSNPRLSCLSCRRALVSLRR